MHDVARRYGVVSRGVVRAGNARAAMAGSYVLRTDPATISLRIDGDKMAVDELTQMMPPLGLVLPAGSSLAGGNASAELAFEGPVDRLKVAGTVGLFETRLSGFDLASNIKQVAAVAGIRIGPDTDIQTLSAKVRSTAEGTTVEELVFVAPAIGELTGSGTIGPRHELDFSMRVKLHTSGALMQAVGQKGDTTIPFFVRGTSDAPKFVPDMKTVAKEKAVALLKSEKVKSIITSEDPLKEAKGLLDNLFKKKKE
jgi:AsmA protein